LIGLTRRETGAFDSNAHRLFLEEWNPECFAEHLFKLGLWIDNLLLAFATAKIRMDMSPWIGPGRTMATWMTRS
jgi:hypothetical protein